MRAAPMVTALLLFAAIVATGCSAGRVGGADADADLLRDGSPDGGPPSDAEVSDSAPEASPDGSADSGPPPLPYVAQCGNGVLDEGEECDDRNRLDGDGCTWDCLIGAGGLPPEPDPGLEPFTEMSDPASVAEETAAGGQGGTLPLTWSGSELATAYFANGEWDGPIPSEPIRFRRFDSHGIALDADWTYPRVFSSNRASIDLVWAETGYGLFYVDSGSTLEEIGDSVEDILFMRLDPAGKPVGDPVVVVTGESLCAPAAAWDGARFGLVWQSRGEEREVPEGWSTSYRRVWARLVGPLGETEGLAGPTLIEDRAASDTFPAVAWGGDLFGVTVTVARELAHPHRGTRFIGVTGDLGRAVYSGILSDAPGADVVFVDDGSGRFVASWLHGVSEGRDEAETCAARFDLEGHLEGPPVCNGVFEGGDSCAVEALVLASDRAGTTGLGVLFAILVDDVSVEGNVARRLLFQHLDRRGRALADPMEVASGSASMSRVAAYGLVAADGLFASLHVVQNGGGEGSSLLLRLFRSGE